MDKTSDSGSVDMGSTPVRDTKKSCFGKAFLLSSILKNQIMRHFMYRFYNRYQIGKPRGDFSGKITPEQLMLRYSADIHKVFPQFSQLPHSYKVNFSNRILSFLQQYAFVSKGGVLLTQQHKVRIATSYIKLTLGLSPYLISTFHTIVVYPTAQYFEEFDEVHVGHFHPKLKTIMIALDEFENDIKNATDGKDISLHEFSHALSFEMLRKNAHHPYESTFKKYYRLLIQYIDDPVRKGVLKKQGLIRAYGFSNRLEWIAVLVELFFERADELRNLHPEIYQLIGKLLNHPSVKQSNK